MLFGRVAEEEQCAGEIHRELCPQLTATKSRGTRSRSTSTQGTISSSIKKVLRLDLGHWNVNLGT